MFKITKGSLPDTYTIKAYMFIKEANFHSFLYSVENVSEDAALYLLKGRIPEDNNEEVKWALDIARLTKCAAVIGEDGNLRAVPIRILEKEFNYEVL